MATLSRLGFQMERMALSLLSVDLHGKEMFTRKISSSRDSTNLMTSFEDPALMRPQSLFAALEDFRRKTTVGFPMVDHVVHHHGDGPRRRVGDSEREHEILSQLEFAGGQPEEFGLEGFDGRKAVQSQGFRMPGFQQSS